MRSLRIPPLCAIARRLSVAPQISVLGGGTASKSRALSTSASSEPAPNLKPPTRPNPMSLRFAYTAKPFYPVWIGNLRDNMPKKARRKIGAGRSGRNGRMMRHSRTQPPHSRTYEGGARPLMFRLPRWPEAAMRNKILRLDQLNLSKLRYAIEKGRIDTRFPITQRHLYDCRAITTIKRGVGLYNVNDFPFPYKIDIEVAGSDQSSIDAIKAVGGTVTVVYMQPVTLRAHVKPWKYEVLPRTARPTLKMVHYLEKMKARGALVRYVKPLWLIEEERRLQAQLRELQGEESTAVAALERITRENERMF